MKSFGLNNYSVGLTNNLHKLALSLFSWKEKGHLEFPTNMDHCLREEHTDFLQSKEKTKNQIINLSCFKQGLKLIILMKRFLQVLLKVLKHRKQTFRSTWKIQTSHTSTSGTISAMLIHQGRIAAPGRERRLGLRQTSGSLMIILDRSSEWAMTPFLGDLQKRWAGTRKSIGNLCTIF